MSANTTMRKFLDTELKPVLPKSWAWSPYQRNFDKLSKITVVWKQTTMTPLPEAPIGSLLVSGVITIIDPHQDVARAEEALDDSVLELVAAIDGLEHLSWSSASKVSVDEQNLGWDINVSVITSQKEQ